MRNSLDKKKKKKKKKPQPENGSTNGDKKKQRISGYDFQSWDKFDVVSGVDSPCPSDRGLKHWSQNKTSSDAFPEWK